MLCWNSGAYISARSVFCQPFILQIKRAVAIIKVKRLSKIYGLVESKTDVLKGINLQIAVGIATGGCLILIAMVVRYGAEPEHRKQI